MKNKKVLAVILAIAIAIATNVATIFYCNTHPVFSGDVEVEPVSDIVVVSEFQGSCPHCEEIHNMTSEEVTR